mgnify:CR=1 FL=1
MAQSSVDLIVNAVKAINPLRAVAKASEKAEKAINSLKRAAKDTGDKLADMGRKGKKGLSDLAAKASQAAGRFGKLGKAAALAAAAAGAAAFLKFSFGQAGELEKAERSLQVLTGSLESAKRIISDLKAFGAVTPFTSAELIETSKRLKAFGFETEQVVDITKRLADVAGATGADLGGIATAFGQIQAKGRLQGEELLQLQERGVALQDELKKMYGLTGEEFSKALSKGQISAKAVEVALVRLTEAGGKYADGAIAQSDTLFGRLSTLQDAFINLGQNIGKALEPIFKFLIDQTTRLVNAINDIFIRNAAVNAVRERERGGKSRAQLGRFMGSAEGIAAVEAEIEKRRAQSAAAKAQAEIPKLTAGTSDLSKAKQRADISKKILDLNKQLIIAEDAQQKRKAATLALMIERQQIAEDNLGANQTELKLLQANQTFRQSIKAIDKEIADQRADEISKAAEGFEAQMKHQDELQQAIAKQKSAYEELNTTFRNGIVDSILAAVEGTKSLSDSLVGVIKSMARLILQQQLLNALSGFNLFGGGGGAGGGFGVTPATSGLDFSGAFANGGRPAVGKAALVGERGPELFVPDRAGTIVPNNALGGSNIVVNVDASGSSVEGDAQQSKALGQAIGAAVQAEIIKQKMPGGLLN